MASLEVVGENPLAAIAAIWIFIARSFPHTFDQLVAFAQGGTAMGQLTCHESGIVVTSD